MCWELALNKETEFNIPSEFNTVILDQHYPKKIDALLSFTRDYSQTN